MSSRYIFIGFLLIQLTLSSYVLKHNKAFAQSLTTRLVLDLSLHGIGTAGDNVSAGTGNANPLHTQRDVKIDIYNSSNQIVVSKQGTVTFNSSTSSFEGVVDWSAIIP